MMANLYQTSRFARSVLCSRLMLPPPRKTQPQNIFRLAIQPLQTGSIDGQKQSYSTKADSLARKIPHDTTTNSLGRSSKTDDSSVPAPPQPSDFAQIVSDLKSPKAVLDAMKNLKFTVENTSLAVHRMLHLCTCDSSNVTPAERKQLLKDARFMRLSDILHKAVPTLNVPMLLDLVRGLLQMSGDDSYLVASLETQIRWMMRKMSVSQLMHVVEIHQNCLTTELRSEIYNEAMLAIERRWVEISSTKDVVTLMYIVGDKSTKFVSKLEDKALDLCEGMTTKELYRVLYIMARHQRRNTPLLRAITYHFNKGLLNLNIVQMSNLLYACANLSIFNLTLLENISSALLLTPVTSESVHLVPSFLQSLSMLRWRHTGILDGLAETLLANVDTVKTSDVLSLLLTCASLDYMSPVLARQLHVVLKKLEGAKTTDPRSWLDAVWCCAVLGNCDSDMAASVLGADFLSLLEEKSLSVLVPVRLRLQNINAVAKYELPNYTGPLLPVDYLELHKVPVRNKRPLQLSVIGTLSSMAPAEKYLKVDVSSPAGYVIDVEMIVNARGELQPISDYQCYTDGTIEVPPNFHRVVLKVLDFPDMTLCTSRPVGFHAMAIRHQRKMGFKVAQITHTEFNENSKVVKRVQLLQRKINEAIGLPSSENKVQAPSK